MTSLKRIKIERRRALDRASEAVQIRASVQRVLAALQGERSERTIRLYMIDEIARQLCDDLEREFTFLNGFLLAKRATEKDA